MSLFNKIYDITHTDLFKYVFHTGSDKVFVANVSKISRFNENVLDVRQKLTNSRLYLFRISRDRRFFVSVTFSLLSSDLVP